MVGYVVGYSGLIVTEESAALTWVAAPARLLAIRRTPSDGCEPAGWSITLNHGAGRARESCLLQIKVDRQVTRTERDQIL